MRLWKSFRVQRRDEISYYDTMGEFEAERFAVNLNQLIAEAMAEKQKAGVYFSVLERTVPQETVWGLW